MQVAKFLIGLWLLWVMATVTGYADTVKVQVLGSGGPELGDLRAGSSYLIWRDGKARVLIDTGPGSSVNFERAGARFEDLDAILFSHFHVDHSADLPTYVKAGYFTDRDRDLPVYGPESNRLMPSANQFIERLFGSQGAFAYLNDYLDPQHASAYHLKAHDVIGEEAFTVQLAEDIQATAVAVPHGPIPALAWRLTIGNCVITFSGDTSNHGHVLEALAKDSDLFVAHHAIPENAGDAAQKLHMPPSVIGDIAGQAKIRHLLLSHLMRRSLAHKETSLKMIRTHYQGPISWAEDGASYQFCQ